jgi:hypothetical protein
MTICDPAVTIHEVIFDWSGQFDQSFGHGQKLTNAVKPHARVWGGALPALSLGSFVFVP